MVSHKFKTGTVCLWDADFKAVAKKNAHLRGQKIEDSDILWTPKYTYIVLPFIINLD